VKLIYSNVITTMFFVMLIYLLPSTAMADAEFVTVAKILRNDDFGIIVRSNGAAYQIEKGVGCISFWRYEGKKVLISSPGLFLGIGAELILPNDNQKCKIWNSKELGSWNDLPPSNTPPNDVIESQIDGDFEGWEGETIVKLTNGQIWRQSEYHYNYHYAFRPNVTIFKTGSGYKMMVDGTDRAVGVTKLK